MHRLLKCAEIWGYEWEPPNSARQRVVKGKQDSLGFVIAWVVSRPFAMLWTIACQAPLSMGFSRQESWSGLPVPYQRDLPCPGLKPASLMPLALTGGFFTANATKEVPGLVIRDNQLPANVTDDFALFSGLQICIISLHITVLLGTSNSS